MYTIDEAAIRAPADICFRAAADVEGWPEALGHYRWVRFQRKDAFGTGLVEMAARRHFGPLPYPVWWVSEMHLNENRREVVYKHVDGITTGMDVVWSIEAIDGENSRVRIIHEWDDGPAWPIPTMIRRWVANTIIGPVFIHHVASRTLRGIAAKAERIHNGTGPVRA